ncbi:hypothetical protein GCM10010298_72990 [Streptomyces microflavus]|uniref:Uncharacterized protein n=1 Tax=Streptomyces microflavus TaxID=1919 RepID=A0A7J0CIM3_STRMI|nr:hypothetical protein Smic_09070 [Streptomyces microflavus]GGX97006.1 hypothetical protein GCM10010298_72990 [Streptomyces microflavus]
MTAVVALRLVLRAVVMGSAVSNGMRGAIRGVTLPASGTGASRGKDPVHPAFFPRRDRDLIVWTEKCQVAVIECGGRLFCFPDHGPGLRFRNAVPQVLGPIGSGGVGVAHDDEQVRGCGAGDDRPASAQ